MIEKIISPKSTSRFSNLICTPDLTLATVNDLTYLQSLTNKDTPADYDIAAVGTITMSGVATLNETFIVSTQTFTWKNTRTTTGEVTIGASASEAVTNIVTAIAADLTGITAVDGSGDTVVVTAYQWYGEYGNSIPFSETSTNMTMDGSGHLGGTVTGDDNYDLLEHIDITGQGYDAIFTASDMYWLTGWSIADNTEVALIYYAELYNNTTSVKEAEFYPWVFSAYMSGGYVFPGEGFQPYVRTILTLVDGQDYTWSLFWKKHRIGASTIAAISQHRILTVQEIKR